MGLGQDIAGIVFSVGTVLAIALPMNLGVYAAVAFGVNWLSALLYAIPRQSEKFYDLTGSITFIALAILGVMLHFDTSNWRSLNASVLVLVWACRLGGFLFARIHASGVDRRFKFIRSSPVTFFMAWTMQGLWNFATILPVLLIHASSPSASPSIVYSDILGLGLWIFGFTIEVIADSQKWAFRKTNPDRFIMSGLWKFSRHPNYFGEITLWTGMAVLCAPHVGNLNVQALTLVSPILCATLLLFVSGVPMVDGIADKKWGGEAAYQAYKRRTSLLVPWFPSTA